MNMTEHEDSIRRRMTHILSEMALERTGWRSIFSRWRYAHEPLRHDAANLLAEIGYRHIYPCDSKPLPPLKG